MVTVSVNISGQLAITLPIEKSASKQNRNEENISYTWSHTQKKSYKKKRLSFWYNFLRKLCNLEHNYDDNDKKKKYY